MRDKRPPIRIHFQFNLETGDIELIVDDNAPDRSEDYHDRVAAAIAGLLARHPEIRDAGPIRYRLNQQWHPLTPTQDEERPQDDTLST